MRQLTGLDASFLYMETPNAPMHIAGLGIYDQSTAPGGKLRFKEIVDNIHRRILELPTMTQRLVKVPFDMDHPYWVTDGTFDPEFHIRHIALPKPGDWRQLCIQVSRINARPLDRDRPLWEIYIIEGLDNVEGVPKGSFAMFSKVHHAAVDGTSSVEMSVAMHDLTADFKRSHKAPMVKLDNKPTTAELLARSTLNNIRTPFHFVSVARNTIPGFAKAAISMGRGELHRVRDIPRTRFNGAVSPHRVFDAINVPLDEVKAIKNSIPGATVNDVAIAIVGGAMRKYLAHHDELPETSMAAMAPINVRSDRDASAGNIVSAMTVKIRSDISDAGERLQAVHEGTRDAKELTNAVGAKAMTDYTNMMPAKLVSEAARLSTRLGLANRMRPSYNCVITNVPGPPIPIFSTGAKMVATYGTGPVVDGLGLFHAVGSYCGQFMISATCCRAMMPDPGFYRECMQTSFDELLASVSTKQRKAS